MDRLDIEAVFLRSRSRPSVPSFAGCSAAPRASSALDFESIARHLCGSHEAKKKVGAASTVRLKARDCVDYSSSTLDLS